MRNTVYMQDLERNIAEYDSEVKGLKHRYRTLFEEIKQVDAAISQKGMLIRSSESRYGRHRQTREQLRAAARV